MNPIDHAVVWVAEEAGWLNFVDGRIVSAYLTASSSANLRRTLRWILACGILALIVGTLYFLLHTRPTAISVPPKPIAVPGPPFNQAGSGTSLPSSGSSPHAVPPQAKPTPAISHPSAKPETSRGSVRIKPDIAGGEKSTPGAIFSSNSKLFLNVGVETFYTRNSDNSSKQGFDSSLNSYERKLSAEINDRIPVREMASKLSKEGVKPGSWTTEFDVNGDGSVDPKSFKVTDDSVVYSIVKHAMLSGNNFLAAPDELQLDRIKLTLTINWETSK